MPTTLGQRSVDKLRRAAFPALCALLATGYSTGTLLSISKAEDDVADRIRVLVADSSVVAMRDMRASMRLQRRDSVARRLEAIDEIDGRRTVWPRLLAEVATALSPDVRLVKLEATGEAPAQALLEGMALSHEHASEYYRRLDMSPSLVDVTPEGEAVGDPPPRLTDRGYRFRVGVAHGSDGANPAPVTANQGSME